MKKVKYIVISFVVFTVLWQLLCSFGGVSDALFPSPVKVWKAFLQLCKEGLPGSVSTITLAGHIEISLLRFLVGYGIAAISGILFGLLFGCLPKAFAYVNPILQVIRPIAPVAFLPFIVLAFGVGDVPAVVIIFIAGFIPVLLSTVSAVSNIDQIYIKVAKNYGLSAFTKVRKVIFPAIFTQVANSLHLALGTSWIFLVSGEMVGAQSGLGFLIMDTKNCIRMDSLMATMITIGVIGLFLDTIMKYAERGLCKQFGYGERRA